MIHSQENRESVTASIAARSGPNGRAARQHGLDCLALIEKRLPTLSGTTRQVAETILRDPWAVLDMTISEVAASSEVSLPSVTRFCRAMGYAGFRELVQELARSLGRADARSLEDIPSPADHAGALSGMAAEIVATQVGALQDTLRALDFAAVERAVDALCATRHATAVGSGGAYVSALGLAFKLGWSGVPIAGATPDMFVNQLAAVSPGDVVIALSHQGRTRDTLGVMRLARSYGATAIAISAVPNAPMLAEADIALAAFSADLARAGTLLVANSAELLVANILAAAVADRRGSDATRRDSVALWIEDELRVGLVGGTSRRRRRSSQPTDDASKETERG